MNRVQTLVQKGGRAVLALMLALVMVVTLMPSGANATSGSPVVEGYSYYGKGYKKSSYKHYKKSYKKSSHKSKKHKKHYRQSFGSRPNETDCIITDTITAQQFGSAPACDTEENGEENGVMLGQ